MTEPRPAAPAAPAPGTQARGGRLAPFRHRPFLVFWTGGLVSNAGSWLQAIASSVYVYQLTGSVVAVGVLNAVGFLPTLLFSVPGGVMADRYDRRHVVIVCSALSLVAAWTLAGLVFAGMGSELLVIATFFVINTLFSLSKPANVSLVPALVPREQVAEAVGWNSLSYILGQIFGPLLATAILLTAGPAWAFFINGLTFLAVIAAVAWLYPLRIGGRATRPGGSGAGATRRVEGGLAYARAHPWVPALLVAIVACTVPFEVVRTLSPALSVALGQTEEAAGVLFAAHSVGAAIGLAVIVPSLRHRGGARLMGSAAIVFQAVGLLAAVVAPTFALACLAVSIVGLGFSLGFPVLTGVLQEEVADRVRGRILALHQMAHLGNRPFAAIGVGVLAGVVGAQLALLGGVLLAPVGLVALRAAWRWLDADPERASATHEAVGDDEGPAPAPATGDVGPAPAPVASVSDPPAPAPGPAPHAAPGTSAARSRD